MKKRIFSMLLALVMVFTMFPTSAIAVGTGTEQDPYQVGDTVANDGTAEPEGVKAENTHWEGTEVPASQTTVCQTEEHDHATAGCSAAYEAVQCLLEGHPEGETAFAHEDGTVCAYDAESALWLTNAVAGYDCGKENHAHTVEAGCIAEVAAYTLWTLVENPPANDGLTSKALNQDQNGALPIHFFLASPGEIDDAMGYYYSYYIPAEGYEEAYTIGGIKGLPEWARINTQNGIRNVSDESLITKYVASWPTGDQGTFEKFGTVRIPFAGTYDDENYEIKWVSIMLRDNDHDSRYMHCNQSYEGEHIHIDGLLVQKIEPGEMEVYKSIPTAVAADTTFHFTLQKLAQPDITSAPTSADVFDPTFDSMTLTATISAGQTEAKITGGDDITFGYYKLTENDAASWENAGVSMTDNNNRTRTDNNARALYIRIAPNGTVQYSTSVSSGYTTMKKVSVLNERKDVTVNYQWRIYDQSGMLRDALPNELGTHGVPASVSVQPGTYYTYNTGYHEGTSYHDYANGLLYTFHGWDTYSNRSAFGVDPAMSGYTALDDGDAVAGNNRRIRIEADTWINGYWSVSELDPVDAYIMVHKDLEVNGDREYVDSYLRNTGKMFIRIDPGIDKDGDGKAQIDVDYPGAVNDDTQGIKVGVYQYVAPFEFTEMQADVPGYDRVVSVAVSGNSNLYLTNAEGDNATVTISPEYEPVTGGYDLGTVTYTNTYTKIEGDPVTVYPTLTLVKRATDTGNLQSGAAFTLYSDADCENAITTYTTDDGVVDIAFASVIEELTANANGTYTGYLKETAAPDGYLVDETVYTLTLTPSEKEELRNNEFVMVTTYALNVTVPANSSAEPVQNAANEQQYSLNVFNDPILGQLKVTKTTVGLDDEAKALLEASVTVHGPITRDRQGRITNLGSEYTLILNEANQWIDIQEKLPIGEYLIHENTATVHGYTWDMNNVAYGELETEVYNNITSGVFEIAADSTDIELTITNTYHEWEAAGFEIHKVDPNGANLRDAAFQLYSDENCEYEVTDPAITTNAVTGTNGRARFDGFTVPAGQNVVTYYLQETKAPAGHYLSKTIYKVEIKAVPDDAGIISFEPKISVEINDKWENAEGFSNTSDILTVVNTPVKGQLKITKNMVNAPTDEKYGVKSVTLYVSGPGYGQTVTLTPDDSGKWEKTLHNLPLGTYTITEQNAEAAGYDLVTTYTVDGKTTTDKATVVLREDKPGETKVGDIFAGAATVTNTYTKRVTTIENPTSLTVKKVGEDGSTPLAGAEFRLVRERDKHTVTYTTNANGLVQFDFLTGTINNGAIAVGEYTLTETKAPDGYAVSDTVWKITVKENDGEVTIKLNEKTNIFENIWDWIIGDDGVSGAQDTYEWANNLLTVKNVELADLTISKSFVKKGAVAGPGHKPGENNTEEEIVPPEGSVIEVAVFDADGKLVKQIELTEANKWTYQLKDIPAGTYTVRESSPSLHGYTWKEAAFTVTGVEPTDVTVAKSAVTVVVENSDDVNVAIKNTYEQWKKVDFYVMKTDTEGNPLAGATFNLYDANGKDVTKNRLHVEKDPDANHVHPYSDNTTVSDGILHFFNFDLKPNETSAQFTLKETSVPENHYGNDNVYKILVTKGNGAYDLAITDIDGNTLTVADHKATFNYANDVLTVVNEEILADLTIKKTFEGGLKPNSVMVKVTGPENYENTVVLGNGNDYSVTLEDLPLGDYTVKELDAAHDGYALTVKYNGQIEEDGQGTVTLEEENDTTPAVMNIHNIYTPDMHKRASFKVQKVDDDDRTKKLEGAKFALFDAAGVLVEEKTTDASGEVTFGPFDKNAVYTLKEIAAPVNYEKTDATWTVTVEDEDGRPKVDVDQNGNNINIWDWIVDIITGQTNAAWDNSKNILTVRNTIKTGNLTVTKTVTDANGLYKDAKYSFTLDCSDNAFDKTFTLEAGDEFTVENIPWGTTYTLTEDTEDAAFISGIADGVNGTIKNETVTIDVTNSYAYTTHNAGLNLIKVDAEDNTKVIEGAGFTLYDEDGNAVGAEEFSDEQGKVNILIAAAGTYTLKETTTPKGYHPNKTEYAVTAEETAVVQNPGTANAVTEMQMHITITDMTGTTDNEIDYTYAIENTAIKHFDVSVQKTWDDGGYHARPASVKAVLKRNNEAYTTVELNAANGWKYTWEDLTDEYDWSVDEKTEPDGYKKNVTNKGNDWTITNTRAPKNVEITVTKAWNHNGGKDLPESIEVTLYRDGEVYKTVTLNEENEWTHTWTGLTDVSEWSVDEVEVPEGYTKKVTVDGYQFTITNTRTINPVEVSVTKVWKETEGIDLPRSIEAVLYRDGKEFKTVRLNARNDWTYTWTGLTDEYTWSVDEKTVPDGFTKNVTSQGNDFTITNTCNKKVPIEQLTTALTVKKVDADGVTPLKNAQFTLKRLGVNNMVIGTVTKTTNANGIAVFDLLSGFAVYGEAIDGKYILSESKAPEGYESTDATWIITVEDDDGEIRWELSEDKNIFEGFWDWIIGNVRPGTFRNGTLTVTNKKKVGSLTIQKQVTDPKALYSDEEYSFKLDASDNRFDKTFTLKAGEAYTVKNIPWGTTYTLTEKTTDAAFTSAITNGGNGKIWADTTKVTVTNTYAYTTHNAGLNLIKVDAEDNTKVIENAGFTLYNEDGEAVSAEVFSDEQGKVNIPVAAAGTYTLKETTTPEGYHPNKTEYVVTAEEKAVVKKAGTAKAVTEMQMHISITGMTGTTANQIDYIYAIENTAIKHFDISVQKTWDDGGYHARPASVKAVLQRDNEAYETVELNAANGWKYTWEDLTDEYSWSVDEAATPAEYIPSVTNEDNDWTITNTRTPKAVEITVTKAWNHNGGKDLPESIQVTLYADGKAKETVTLNEANGWTYTWTGLTDVSVWSVDEVEIPEGYTKTVKVDGYKFEITNTRTINPVEVSVTKEWVASEGVILPESIEAVLYRDGKEFKTVKLSADNEWTYKWTDLTDEYTWSVDEKTVPDGYTKNVTNDGNDFTITNTKNFKIIDVSVEKVWYGANVTHPASIEVTLYRDGVVYDTVKLDAAGGWKYVWKDLTDEFVWTVDEPSVPSGYTKEVKDLGGYAFQITNTHEDIPKTGDFTDVAGLAMMGTVGVFGFLATALFLLFPRKKGKYER